MANYKKVTLTNQGRTLMNDLISSSKSLSFTRMATTEQSYSDRSIEELTAIPNEVQTEVIYHQERIGDETIRVEVLISNEELNTSYAINSIGVYVKDLEGKEILFGVASAERAFQMYSSTSGMPTSATFRLHVGIGQAELATLERAPIGMANVSDIINLQDKMEEVVDSIDELKNNMGSLIASVEVTNTKWESEEVDIDIATGTMGIANHGLTDGDRIAMVSFEKDNSIVPSVKEGFPYYVVNSNTNTFQISELKDGLPISIDSTGSSPYWQIEWLRTAAIYITGLDLERCKVLIHGAGTVSGNNNRFHTFAIPDIRPTHYLYNPFIYDGYNKGALVNTRATRHFFTALNLYTDRHSTYINYRTDVSFLTDEIPSTSVRKEYNQTTYTLPSYGYNKITRVGLYQASEYLFDGTTLEVYSLE